MLRPIIWMTGSHVTGSSGVLVSHRKPTDRPDGVRSTMCPVSAPKIRDSSL